MRDATARSERLGVRRPLTNYSAPLLMGISHRRGSGRLLELAGTPPSVRDEKTRALDGEVAFLLSPFVTESGPDLGHVQRLRMLTQPMVPRHPVLMAVL